MDAACPAPVQITGAVLAIIIGQAQSVSRPILPAFAAVVACASITFVYGCEQPTLTRRYGARYQASIRALPRWWPLLLSARQSMETTGGHHANHRPAHRPRRLQGRRA
jgi:hypothetical protein